MFDNQGNIIAILTIFGWVIISIVITGCSSTTTMHTAIDIDASLRRFWELEDVNQEFHGKPEDDEVEQHFYIVTSSIFRSKTSRNSFRTLYRER